MSTNKKYTGFEVAIVGMACRFPGANDWRKFWDNLTESQEVFNFLSDEELRKMGAGEDLIANENFVRAVPDFMGKEFFDAAFFDYTPDEARVLGPQNRIFHECVWEAFEDAGYIPDEAKGLVGLYGSGADDLNWRIYAKLTNQQQNVSDFILKHISDKDYLPPLISYKLNMKGASMNLTSACSSSLLGIHLACRALIFGEVNMAAAGGIFLNSSKYMGYHHQEGSIMSKDGRCRAFDKESTGTITGEGTAVLILKRLVDAQKDGDHIYSIIKGSAVNNDGKRKIGLTAPSVDGQTECLKLAQRFSKVEASSIKFIETHGTGTSLGDTIEIAAINNVFKEVKHPIPIGSVKTNIGHLDTAAGVAGVIKAALSLKYKQLPPSLHFTEANPHIGFDEGPLYVNDKVLPLEKTGEEALRAGVSSLGVGGTNVHTILEEAPPVESTDDNQWNVFTLSAKTKKSLRNYVEKLKHFVERTSDLNLSDAAHTFQIGRKHFDHRLPLVFENKTELLEQLEGALKKDKSNAVKADNTATVFMFPGQGAQYVNMGKDLYDNFPVFKKAMDHGFDLLKKRTGTDFYQIVYPDSNTESSINETRYAQPLIFIFEYALAQLVKSFGIVADVMIGHSVGEYVVATLNGVFKYEDALGLLLKRGQLMFDLPAGDMLSVGMPAEEATQYLEPGIDLATVNGPKQCVLSGQAEQIEALAGTLKAKGISTVKLKTSHAFHSAMLDPMLDEFENAVREVTLSPFTQPFISNLTGEYITPTQATSATYWVQHMRNAVLFSKGVKTILKHHKNSLFLEIGPGRALSGLIRQHSSEDHPTIAINLVRRAKQKLKDARFLMEQLAYFWSYGKALDWSAFHSDSRRNKVPLPTYAFEKIKYPAVVDPFELLNKQMGKSTASNQASDWLYRPYWKASYWLPDNKEEQSDDSILIFSNRDQLGDALNRQLDQEGRKYFNVFKGDTYSNGGEEYKINPEEEDSYGRLFAALEKKGIKISKIIHTWTYEKEAAEHSADFYQLGYQSLMAIAKKIKETNYSERITIEVITNQLFNPFGEENSVLEKSTLLGASKVMPLEFPSISCRVIDLDVVSELSFATLWRELNNRQEATEVALRHKNRYVREYEALHFDYDITQSRIKKNGTYFIADSESDHGRLLAKYLAKEYQANLLLHSTEKEDTVFTESLKANGTTIYFLQGELHNRTFLEKELKKASAVLDSVNGVFHTSALEDTGGMIFRRDKTTDENFFKEKLEGLENLYSVFEKQALDFFLTCSSRNTALTDPGKAGETATNTFQDYFAERTNAAFPVLSVGWETIGDVGAAANFIQQLNPHEKNMLLENCIHSGDVPLLLERTLFLQLPVQIISKKPLNERIQMASRSASTLSEDAIDQEGFVVEKIERPNLKSTYVSPSNETEKRLVTLLENFFGIEGLGIEDDIFELGVDSLKLMVFNRRLLKEFEIELPIEHFYDHPLIGSLAKEIDSRKIIVDLHREEVSNTQLNEILI